MPRALFNHEYVHSAVAADGDVTMPEPMSRPSFLGRDGPASIRYNNPGAQYPGKSARKHGTIGTKTIGGGHLIAVFDDAIDGGAALFDLLDRVYTGMTVKAAIAKWSGGNHVGTYLAVMQRRGIDPDTMISKEKLRDPEWALMFAKAMAWHEAGQDYPLTDDDWRMAHRQAFFDVVEAPVVSRKEAKDQLKTGSKKWSVSSFFKWFFGFFGGGALTWPGIKASMEGAGDFANAFVQMVTAFGIHIVAGVLIVGAIAFNWLQTRMVDDVQAGRATPSGRDE